MARATLYFPMKGKDTNMAASTQPPLTSPLLNNVRPYDVLETRARGGQRPALKKKYSQLIGSGSQPIVAMCQVVTVS